MLKSPQTLKKEEFDKISSRKNFLQKLANHCIERLETEKLSSIGGLVSIPIDGLLYINSDTKQVKEKNTTEQEKLRTAYENFEESVPFFDEQLLNSGWVIDKEKFFDECPPGRPLCIVQQFSSGNQKMLFYLKPHEVS